MLLNDPENVIRISTYTTRPKRPLEDDLGQYRYVSQEEFNNLSLKGYFIAPNIVNGYCYGCPRIDIHDEKYKGKIMLLDIGVKGAKDILSEYKNAISMYIIPPNKERLKAQMSGRDKTRWSRNIKQIQEAKEVCKWLVINDDASQAALNLDKICHIILQNADNIKGMDTESASFLYERSLHNKKNIDFLDNFYGRNVSFPPAPNK